MVKEWLLCVEHTSSVGRAVPLHRGSRLVPLKTETLVGRRPVRGTGMGSRKGGMVRPSSQRWESWESWRARREGSEDEETNRSRSLFYLWVTDRLGTLLTR